MAVSVVVEERIKEGQLAAYVSYLAEMIALTKQEEGNIAYDLYEAADGSGDVVMIELWESKEALDKHMQSEHFQKFIPGGDIFKNGQSRIRVFNRL
jgi:quinol monooxygenase YgiN